MEPSEMAASDKGLGPTFPKSIPLSVLALSLSEPEKSAKEYPDYRLSALVVERLDMDDDEIAKLASLTCCTPPGFAVGSAPDFEQHLRELIAQYGLYPLFQDDGPGRFHHAIRPSGYDYDADKVEATGMENWRAFYRGMSAERQMLAASIIWLYRGRKDNRWLRRVPCTWNATEAILKLRSNGMLSGWGRLIMLYPGW
ncbi:hypothetical protein FHS82_004028 [Pseudochelatococcus lubricantis]|uniref:Uncharacterized protein n=1 Tax=Pseudochelatococcus lubricantis TaxID=1538102 RepID=A0ABX0V4N1_9HYPH|nr:hypothetical protein [Pseudochelatococcus lubricantis]NIJ60161.1 hypothetical protein [Pseudochelatococcus lubricantis]